MNCHDLDSEGDTSETTTDPLASISQAILAELTHLDLGSRLVKKRRIVSGGAYGDISRGHCLIGEGMVNVAVKCLRFYLKKDIRTLFEKEIYVWLKLRHENILSLLGVFNLVFGIANGLAYLHRNGVVHSDIKADNVLVSTSGDALICDFGCSLMMAASRSLANLSSGVRGTTRYLACELVAPLPLGHTEKTDVWAFGMTVYEPAFRRRPFAKLSDFQVLTALLEHATPSFPTPLPNDFHNEEIRVLQTICTACWRRSPQHRPDMSWILDKISDSPVFLHIQSDLQAHTHFGECTAAQTDSRRLSEDHSYSGFEPTELISAIDSEFSYDGKSTIIEPVIEGSSMSSDPLLQIVDMIYRAMLSQPARYNSGSTCQARKPRRKVTRCAVPLLYHY
ncbi:hypothetical protein ACEPAH_7364 [Sanghuangporus vaninii]